MLEKLLRVKGKCASHAPHTSFYSKDLLRFLLTNWISYRFWFPNTSGSFGFRVWGSISQRI
jgi:hypothetical protein